MSTILIIDDDSAIRQMLLRVLQVNGHSTLEAENGEVGIQLANQWIPDLILCDAVMPEMSGLETLSILHQSSATRDIPVVMMSGLIPETQLKQALTMGAVDYLPKPFTLDELRQSIKRAEGARQQVCSTTES
jgi:CheY-like chemotaxis protein